MALHLSGISTRAKLVMIGLCDCANDDTFDCFPSRKHLAQIGDCSTDTVDRALRELADALLVEVQPQYRDEGSRIPTANLYRVFPAFDPSRKSAATPREDTRIPAQRVSAVVRLPTPQAGAATLAARDAATNEPSIEPSSVVSCSADGPTIPVSKQVIEALIERCGDGCDSTAASLHHGADLNRMLRAGCDWVEDIEPAADRVAASFRAKGKRFRSWELLIEHAVDFRDRRLAGLPAPQPVTEQTKRTGKADAGAVIDRIFGAAT
jgi:hypothetical protein